MMLQFLLQFYSSSLPVTYVLFTSSCCYSYSAYTCIISVTILSVVCSGEKKPKLDLLRTCVAAVPKLMPANDLSISELVEMLLRFTVHIDEELRA